jgi:DNA-binding response OmpR family regulator
VIRILIIEENETFADLVGQYLQRKGLEAHVTADGGSGLRAFDAGCYDLLLVNLELRVFSGDEVCRQVRKNEQGAKIPIIMLSGFVKDQAQIDRLKAEFRLSGFLQKPFPPEALYNLISRTLQVPETPAAGTPSAPSQKRSTDIPTAVRGDLSKTPFEQVLLYLMLKQATGVLQVRQASSERTFYFLDGAPVDVDVPPGEDDFGSYLARKNLVTPAELDAYLDRRSTDETDPRDLFVKMGTLRRSAARSFGTAW